MAGEAAFSRDSPLIDMPLHCPSQCLHSNGDGEEGEVRLCLTGWTSGQKHALLCLVLARAVGAPGAWI